MLRKFIKKALGFLRRIVGRKAAVGDKDLKVSKAEQRAQAVTRSVDIRHPIAHQNKPIRNINIRRSMAYQNKPIRGLPKNTRSQVYQRRLFDRRKRPEE